MLLIRRASPWALAAVGGLGGQGSRSLLDSNEGGAAGRTNASYSDDGLGCSRRLGSGGHRRDGHGEGGRDGGGGLGSFGWASGCTGRGFELCDNGSLAVRCGDGSNCVAASWDRHGGLLLFGFVCNVSVRKKLSPCSASGKPLSGQAPYALGANAPPF